MKLKRLIFFKYFSIVYIMDEEISFFDNKNNILFKIECVFNNYL